MANSWINRKTRDNLYNRDSQWMGVRMNTPTCCYCGKACKVISGNVRDLARHERKSIVSLDHIVSQKDLAESSNNDKEFYSKRRDPKNLVVVCVGCNSSKQHTPLYVWCERTHKDYGKVIAEIARRIESTGE